MIAIGPRRVEAAYLDAVILDEIEVYVWLTNGVRLQGRLYDYDVASVLLSSSQHEGGSTLVYKAQVTSIARVSPKREGEGDVLFGLLR